MENVFEVLSQLKAFDILRIAGISILLALYIRWFIRFTKKNNNKAKRFRELEALKCDGPHDWLFMDINGKNVNVCKKCYWSPAHEGYVKKLFVDAEIRSKFFKSECEKHLEDRLKDLEVSRELYDELINIKKDFTLKYIDARLEEMTAEKVLGE